MIDIQRHVLQKKALDSKYKKIAADVNANGAIDGLDVLELRKLVMKPDSKFANNTSDNYVRYAPGVITSSWSEADGQILKIC